METRELTELIAIIGGSAGAGAALLEAIKKVRGSKTKNEIIKNLNEFTDELTKKVIELREENLRLRDENYQLKNKG